MGAGATLSHTAPLRSQVASVAAPSTGVDWAPVRVTCVAGQAATLGTLDEPAGGLLGRLVAAPAESTTK